MPPSSRATPRSIVVVGAGLAAATTVAALRRFGFDGRIDVLGMEGVPPYDRPPLSKELLTRTEPAWLTTDLGIDLEALADHVRWADPALELLPVPVGWRVRTRSGAALDAEAVVLAVGSAPIMPPGWAGALTLHTVADADALRERLRRGDRLAVIGAGWIGAEIAGIARGAGMEVVVLEAAGTPLERQLGRDVGLRLTPWYTDTGVDLRTGSVVTDVRPDGVRTAHGDTVSADVVLAAVGARPATDWLRGAVPLDGRGFVPVDTDGRVLDMTGAQDSMDAGGRGLWAVGDCAARQHPVYGRVPGGHWSAALHDPEPTARALLGLTESAAGGEPMPPAPYVFSQQLGHDLALVGIPDAARAVVYRGDPDRSDGTGWAALYVDRPDSVATVHAVLTVDAPREIGPVRRLLGQGAALRLDLAVALDPTRRLRDAVA